MTVFGRRATYAVLAVVLVAAAVLMAAPAWSQDSQKKESAAREDKSGDTKTSRMNTGKGSGQAQSEGAGSGTAQNTNAGKSSTQDEKKTSTSERAKEGTSKKSSAKAQKKGAKQDPVRGKDVAVEGDVLTVSGDFELSKKGNASVTVKDGKGKDNRVTFDDDAITIADNGNLEIRAGNAVSKLDRDKVEARNSKRVKAAKDNRRDGRRGRGGRGNGINCEIIFDQLIRDKDARRGDIQYNNIEDVLLQCINQNPSRFDPEILEGLEELDDIEEILEDLEDDEEESQEVTIRVIEERSADQPDGQVLDTSKLTTLPNTGGPDLIGGALVASSLALLGGGVGLSIWRLGNRRGRSDD